MSERWVTEAAHEGDRLDMFVSARVEYSRSYVQDVIRNGGVLLDGKSSKPNVKLKAGMKIEWNPPEAEETAVLPEEISLDILYEDGDIVIVNKKRGMVVHPAPGNPSGTLVNALLFHCKDLSGINGEIRPGIVHRLDKDTSGVMMAAKNDIAHAGLAEQVKSHEAKRTYYALVKGNISEEKGIIDAPIGRHPKERLKMAVVFGNSKPARTHFKVLERYGAYTLVECELETGRTHQIRVHFAYIGYPVVNDPLYGPRKAIFPIEGQALHSRTLDIVHPVTKEAMHFEAPLPDDFLSCLRMASEGGIS